MEQYKVLLVDDEEEIRCGISRRIDWNSLGLQLVGEAENGVEALEIAEQIKPDIVLTDIKMPFMDGLELCDNLRTQLPTAKIIVFSGFDEFEYARKAVSMNVSQYILKPINAPELNEVLQKLKQELDAEAEKRRNEEILRKSYEESLPVLREMFFSNLLNDKINADEINTRANAYKIELPQANWNVALIHGDLIKTAVEKDAVLLTAKGLVEKHFLMEETVQYVFLYNGDLAILTGIKNSQTVYALMAELERVRLLLQSYLDVSLSIGIGRMQNDVANIHMAASEANSALEYRALTQTNVIYLGDMEKGSEKPLVFEKDDEQAIVLAIKLGTKQQIDEVIEGFLKRVAETGADIMQYQMFFMELSFCILRLTRNNQIEPKEVFGENFGGTVQLSDFSSLEEVLSWCKKCCFSLHELLHTRRNDYNWRTMERAKKYIDENYKNVDLNVDALCLYLHLSPAYFSTLFKRETTKSFTNYVTDVRMGVAADLLINTDDKTYLIAEKTGYADPNYFSYVFKRYYGISPSKYRVAKQ